MALEIKRLHLKTRDPRGAAQFHVDNFVTTIVAETGPDTRSDPHGLKMNVSGLIATQTREQRDRMEHMALDTDDDPDAMARLRARGVKNLEELVASNGRRVRLCEGPDSVQVEIIERAVPPAQEARL
jgi:hypothetical protein